MQFSYSATPQTLVQQALNAYYLGPNSRLRQLVTSLALLILGAWVIFNFFAAKPNFQLSLAVFLLSFGWLILNRFFLKKVLLKKILLKKAAQPTQPQQLSFWLEEDGIRQENTFSQWHAWHTAVHCPEGFLLYPGALWLPINGLESTASSLEVAALLRRKLPNFLDKSQARFIW